MLERLKVGRLAEGELVWFETSDEGAPVI